VIAAQTVSGELIAALDRRTISNEPTNGQVNGKIVDLSMLPPPTE
jgi:hypothetical protein